MLNHGKKVTKVALVVSKVNYMKTSIVDFVEVMNLPIEMYLNLVCFFGLYTLEREFQNSEF